MSGSAAASASSSATSTALSVATAAICFAVGYVNQLLVRADPFGDDPRPVTGTHTLYTPDELKAMKSDKDRVDAYYNVKADLHDVLEATLGTRNVNDAYPRLKGRDDLQLLKKAIEQFYPAAATPAAPVPAPAPASALPLQPIHLSGGSNSDSHSNQTNEVAGGSTDAPRPQFGGGEQPKGYLPGHAYIGVGQ